MKVGSSWHVNVPAEVHTFATKLLRERIEAMIVRPVVRGSKIVVEEDPLLMQIVVRILYAVEFNDGTYTENWMLALVGYNKGGEFDVKRSEFCVAQSDGWNVVDRKGYDPTVPRITEPNAKWPLPIDPDDLPDRSMLNEIDALLSQSRLAPP